VPRHPRVPFTTLRVPWVNIIVHISLKIQFQNHIKKYNFKITSNGLATGCRKLYFSKTVGKHCNRESLCYFVKVAFQKEFEISNEVSAQETFTCVFSWATILLQACGSAVMSLSTCALSLFTVVNIVFPKIHSSRIISYYFFSMTAWKQQLRNNSAFVYFSTEFKNLNQGRQKVRLLMTIRSKRLMQGKVNNML